jgi:hypothetical protein
MQKLLLLLLCVCFALSASAQLRLQELNGNKTRDIGLNSEITVRLSTPSSLQEKNPYQDYRGKLLSFRNDSIEMNAQLESRYYADEQGVYKLVSTNYCCPPDQNAIVTFPTAEAFYVRKHKSEVLQGVGGLLLVLALAHSVGTAPLLTPEARSVSDKVVGAGFAVGLGLAVLPRSKTYHLAGSKKEGGKRWRIVQP